MKDITSEINQANTSAALHQEIKKLRKLDILQPDERFEIYQAILNHERLDTVGIDLLIQAAHSTRDLDRIYNETYQRILKAYLKLIPGTEMYGLIHLIEAVKTLPKERIIKRHSSENLMVELLQGRHLTLKILIKMLYEVKEIENRTSWEMQCGFNLAVKGLVFEHLAERKETPPPILQHIKKETETISAPETKKKILRNLEITHGITQDAQDKSETQLSKVEGFVAGIINSIGTRGNKREK